MMLGVDIGTQSLKAVVLTAACEILGEGAVAYQPVFPEAGHAEQDPRLWERALAPAIAAALEQAGLSARDVTSLGVAGQLDGVVPAGEDGAALAACLIWMDRRAEGEIAGIEADLVLNRCGVVLDAGHPAAKIRWLKRKLAARRYHTPVSYIVSRLTGAHVIDRATASTTMLYGLRAQAYDPELLAAFGIGLDELPVAQAAEQAAGVLTAAGAALTGLPAGLTVATGTGDDFSSALGAGLTGPGRFLNVLGTAEVVGTLVDEPVFDPGRLVETHAYPGGGYFLENPGWLSGGAITWFCETFGAASPGAVDELAASVPPGADGVIFLPALTGAMSPEWIASARGAFFGLTAAHGRAHCARALLEGTAFAMKDVLDRVVALGAPVEALRIAGGGARSKLWTRIRADLTGLPAEIPRHSGTSAIGAALLGGVAGGALSGLRDAAQIVAAGLEVVEPDAGAGEAYHNAHGRYRRLFEALKPMHRPLMT